MKKLVLLALLALLVVLVAACGSDQAPPTVTATPAVEPTARTAPTLEPTTEPTVPPPNAETAADLATYGQALAAGELFQDPDSLAQMLSFNEQALPIEGAPFGLGLIDLGGGYWGHEGQAAGLDLCRPVPLRAAVAGGGLCL